jgi:Transglutaminase-like superfamily
MTATPSLLKSHPMAAKLQQLLALNTAEKTTLLKAWFLLGYTRAAILATSFKRLSASLDHHRESIKPPTITPQQLKTATNIGYLVSAAANHTPWQSLCLVQVLVTQRLLAKRNIPGQFYLGVRRGSEFTDDPTGLSAHAWLQCGDQIVNGAAGHEQFTVVSTFRWGEERA